MPYLEWRMARTDMIAQAVVDIGVSYLCLPFGVVIVITPQPQPRH
jgi:hypothetical protein